MRYLVLSLAVIGVVISFCVFLGWDWFPRMRHVGLFGMGACLTVMAAACWRQASAWHANCLRLGIALSVIAVAVAVIPNHVVNAGSGQDGLLYVSIGAGLLAGAPGILLIFVGIIGALVQAAEARSSLSQSDSSGLE